MAKVSRRNRPEHPLHPRGAHHARRGQVIPRSVPPSGQQVPAGHVGDADTLADERLAYSDHVGIGVDADQVQLGAGCHVVDDLGHGCTMIALAHATGRAERGRFDVGCCGKLSPQLVDVACEAAVDNRHLETGAIRACRVPRGGVSAENSLRDCSRLEPVR